MKILLLLMTVLHKIFKQFAIKRAIQTVIAQNMKRAECLVTAGMPEKLKKYDLHCPCLEYSTDAE